MNPPTSIATRARRVAIRARWSVVLICGFSSLFASSAAFAASRLAGISSLVHVESGESPSVTGFVVTGHAEKFLLVRGIGPGLRQLGLGDGLPDPVLRVFNAAGREIHRGTAWSLSSYADEIAHIASELGAPALAPGSADAALLIYVGPGNYTLSVESASNQAGAVLTEVYEAGCDGRLTNLATLACVNASHSTLFGTFRVNGDAPKKFLIRAVGPSLNAMGVDRALPDPQLVIYSYAGAGTVARNDDWSATVAIDSDPDYTAAVALACGAFPLAPNGKDAAVVVTLDPGAYTVQVTGKGTDTGLVLLEIYAVP
jgi:hypothetical protein